MQSLLAPYTKSAKLKAMKKPSKKMGRPRKPTGDLRSRQINIRVAPDEYRAMADEARQRGCSMSKLMLSLWQESQKPHEKPQFRR